MSSLKIIVAPDPRLLKISKPVNNIDKNINILLEDMLETMYKNNGIGLAAPQIGVLKRLIVMDCSDKNTKAKPIKFINPEILNFSSELNEFEEGCLSLPTQYAKVERPKSIDVQYKDENGRMVKKLFSGIEATCLQHEIDHLDGKLMVDYISPIKRDRIKKKLLKK